MLSSKLPIAPDVHTGRKLGKYEIVCRLSTGGMSEIFLAFQRGLAGFRKFVVLKQILPDIKGEEEFVRMFLDEAKITAAFNHPNIAQVYDLDVAEGELFLAMEFVPGATLVEVAKACRAENTPIPTGFALAAVRDTALALHYAHNFTSPAGQTIQVIHRDVAEKNIMVTYEGVTKLLDFGIAKRVGQMGRTMVGTVKGTSGYMSPEQVLGEPLDQRSDLFSLGVVLHELLTGLRLFHGQNPEAAMLAATREGVAPPSRINNEVTPALDGIIKKALARDRSSRFASCLEFARELEATCGPQIWLPEQTSKFINGLFGDRLAQTQSLLSGVNEATGEIKLTQILGGELPAPIELLPEIDAPAPIGRKPTPLATLKPRSKTGESAPPQGRTGGTDLIPLPEVVPPPPMPLPEAKQSKSDRHLMETAPARPNPSTRGSNPVTAENEVARAHSEPALNETVMLKMPRRVILPPRRETPSGSRSMVPLLFFGIAIALGVFFAGAFMLGLHDELLGPVMPMVELLRGQLKALVAFINSATS
jgi:eukaryotic-like serine/threonine-protein kinase